MKSLAINYIDYDRYCQHIYTVTYLGKLYIVSSTLNTTIQKLECNFNYTCHALAFQCTLFLIRIQKLRYFEFHVEV